jgi:hypothetical protein
MAKSNEEVFNAPNLNYIFEGNFELEEINNAISFFNNNESPVNFFIDTPGGYVSYVYILSLVIEEYKDVILYPIQECSSSGFLLLLNTTVPIKLIDRTIRCSVHFPRIDTTFDLNKNHIYPKEDFKIKTKNNIFIEQLKNINISSKLKSKLLRGEDVILYYEDLLEIFKDRIIHE